MMIPWLTPEKQLQAYLLLRKEKEMILLLQMTTKHAYCPSCGTKSLRLHSRYMRFLYDLPFGSQHTAIHFVSRKWFCDENGCTQRIFTERFSWLKPYARRTERLQQLLRKLAFSMSCLQAEKLARSFLPKMSHDTFLRLIRATPTHVSIPSAVGIDDFSFRKGHAYGTLICDLITHQPLAILSDRTGETVTQWLKQHSQIQMVSRDGSITYREAIEKANPKIQQVSDRWHLMKNAREGLEKWLERHIPLTIEWPVDTKNQKNSEPSPPPVDEEKWKLIEHIQTDYQEGMRVTHLAKKYQLARGTIYKYLDQQTPPVKTQRRIKPAQLKLQPYYEAIIGYDEQHFTTNQIIQKLHSQGYAGSGSAVRRFLEPYRASKKQRCKTERKQYVTRKQVASYLWVSSDALTEKKRAILKYCQTKFPCLVQAEDIIQQYRTFFKMRDLSAFLDWMTAQLSNKHSPLHSHSKGIRKDLSAVKNALTMPFHNGLLEGHINRLKFLKRMMYGRANPDLLEKRVLYRP